MKNIRERFVVTLKYGALVCAAWLLSATCTWAAPITIGTFQFQFDPSDPFASPTFVVTNDSSVAGYAALFADVHLLFDLTNLSTLDFTLIGDGAGGTTEPVGAVTSNGLVDPDFGQSLLPDLDTVLDAYVTLTLLDVITNAVLPGTLSLGPTNPPMCLGCTNRMTDFSDLSTLAIRFDPAPDGTPVPEPASLFLVGSGFAALAVKKRWLAR